MNKFEDDEMVREKSLQLHHELVSLTCKIVNTMLYCDEDYNGPKNDGHNELFFHVYRSLLTKQVMRYLEPTDTDIL